MAGLDRQIQDETELSGLIEHLAEAVREENWESIRANHAPDVLMFDVPPPFLSRGLDAYMETWRTFFACAARPVVFRLEDVEITAGRDVAFATAVGHCENIERNGVKTELTFRLTMGFRKLDGRWWIVHEHHSLPALD